MFLHEIFTMFVMDNGTAISGKVHESANRKDRLITITHASIAENSYGVRLGDRLENLYALYDDLMAQPKVNSLQINLDKVVFITNQIAIQAMREKQLGLTIPTKGE